MVQTDFAVALHFKTLFGEGVEAGKAVVLNSKNVTWGQEEFYTNKWQRPGSRKLLLYSECPDYSTM